MAEEPYGKESGILWEPKRQVLERMTTWRAVDELCCRCLALCWSFANVKCIQFCTCLTYFVCAHVAVAKLAWPLNDRNWSAGLGLSRMYFILVGQACNLFAFMLILWTLTGFEEFSHSIPNTESVMLRDCQREHQEEGFIGCFICFACKRAHVWEDLASSSTQS